LARDGWNAARSHAAEFAKFVPRARLLGKKLKH